MTKWLSGGMLLTLFKVDPRMQRPISSGIELALYLWSRYNEFTADRAACLVSNDPQAGCG